MDIPWLAASPWPIVTLVFAGAIALITLGWLFERANQRRYARVLATGEPAEATVLAARDTGWRTMGRVHIGYTLEVRRQGHPPYQARTRLMIHRPWSTIPYPPGSVVAVRVDPAQPQRVVFAATTAVLGGGSVVEDSAAIPAASRVFVADGQAYRSIDELPPEARTAFSAAMSAFAAADGDSPPESVSRFAGSSALERLRELAAMRNEGLISAAEYEAKKAEILERL
jgi:hypothetical protein